MSEEQNLAPWLSPSNGTIASEVYNLPEFDFNQFRHFLSEVGDRYQIAIKRITLGRGSVLDSDHLIPSLGWHQSHAYTPDIVFEFTPTPEGEQQAKAFRDGLNAVKNSIADYPRRQDGHRDFYAHLRNPHTEPRIRFIAAPREDVPITVAIDVTTLSRMLEAQQEFPRGFAHEFERGLSLSQQRDRA